MVGRHGSWSRELRAHILSGKHKAEQRKLDTGQDYKNESPPIATYFMASILSLPQTAPPTGEQVFRHLNLWGTFPFKLLQYPCFTKQRDQEELSQGSAGEENVLGRGSALNAGQSLNRSLNDAMWDRRGKVA